MKIKKINIILILLFLGCIIISPNVLGQTYWVNETFEGYTECNYVLPTGWTRWKDGASEATWGVVTFAGCEGAGSAHGGTKYLAGPFCTLYTYVSTGPITMYANGTGYTVSMWFLDETVCSPFGSCDVPYLGTSAGTLGTMIGTPCVNATTTYQNITRTFTVPSDGTYYIQFVTGSSNCRRCLDDLQVYYTTLGTPACTTPTDPTASGTATICSGVATNISATSTNATTIYWYTGSCGGTLIGTSAPGANYSVSPTTTTTYYARGYNSAGGGCWSAGCGSVTITVSPNNTITWNSGSGSTTQTVCIGTAITTITYTTTGATGATFSGLPAGVTGSWAANTVTISGTPSASGTFNYTVTLAGGCP